MGAIIVCYETVVYYQHSFAYRSIFRQRRRLWECRARSAMRAAIRRYAAVRVRFRKNIIEESIRRAADCRRSPPQFEDIFARFPEYRERVERTAR